MTDVIQIPQLPPVNALNGTEQLEGVQAGVSVQITTQQIANYAAPSQTIASFEGLPSAVSNAGVRRFITNSSTTTFYDEADGSGSNAVPVFSDGSVWRVG